MRGDFKWGCCHKMAKKTYQAASVELAGLRIGETPQDQLKWFLSFVNQGTWKRTKEGPGLESLTFSPGWMENQEGRQKLIDEVEAFSGRPQFGLKEGPLDKNGLANLQWVAASILVGMGSRGTVMQDLPECKIIVFPDREGRLHTVITGNRKTRFFIRIKNILEVIDLKKLRSCPECLSVFYAIKRQIYCGTPCSNRKRAKQFYRSHRDKGRKARSKRRKHRSKISATRHA